MSAAIACLPPIESRQAPPAAAAPLVVPGGRLLVDLAALAANWRFLQAKIGAACTAAAVVKADGYGLGMVPAATALAEAGCRDFFVALPGEGQALGKALSSSFADARIAVLSGPLEPGDHGSALVPVLNSLEQVRRWRETAPARPAFLHLDTGMARLGIPACDIDAVLDLAHTMKLAGVISHLACADEPENPLNARQGALFDRLTAGLPAVKRSLAASSGTFLGANFHYQMIRPGAALYGINPTPGRPNPMRPVVRLQARILQIQEIEPGESVGYGASWTAARRSRLATVGLGYADGVMRAAGNNAGGVRIPIVGRVSMDLTTLDVSDLPENSLAVGGFIDLVGPQYDLDAFARDSGTVAYEVLTRIGARVPRVYTDRGAMHTKDAL